MPHGLGGVFHFYGVTCTHVWTQYAHYSLQEFQKSQNGRELNMSPVYKRKATAYRPSRGFTMSRPLFFPYLVDEPIIHSCSGGRHRHLLTVFWGRRGRHHQRKGISGGCNYRPVPQNFDGQECSVALQFFDQCMSSQPHTWCHPVFSNLKMGYFISVEDR